MSWNSFWILFVITAVSLCLFRVLPMLALANRELPKPIISALEYIPIAAFTALVANDLIDPVALSQGFWPALMPTVAAIPVVVVALKTRSLALCIVVGIAAYAMLMFFF